MHPEILRPKVKIKIGDELTWAERERRAILSRRTPAPDAVMSDPPMEHLSFAARVRTILDILHPVSELPVGVARA
jgi:hypothetical protein